MTMDFLTIFPKEIGDEVLSLLEIKDLGKCCQVSKLWKMRASADKFWHKLVPEIAIPENTLPKKYLDQHVISTLGQLFEKVQKILNKQLLKEEFQIRVTFPANPSTEISFQWLRQDKETLKAKTSSRRELRQVIQQPHIQTFIFFYLSSSWQDAEESSAYWMLSKRFLVKGFALKCNFSWISSEMVINHIDPAIKKLFLEKL